MSACVAKFIIVLKARLKKSVIATVACVVKYTVQHSAPTQGADFQWLSGAASVKTITSSVGVRRTFCAACGSTLQALFDDEPDMIYLTMGTVKGNPPHPEPFHIFVGSKAHWYTITDNFPQYEEWRDHPFEKR